jgi:choline kinase
MFTQILEKSAMAQTSPVSAPVQAVILAAGVGKRLTAHEPDHLRRPKAMLDFGGASLLARHLAILRRHGVTQITIVVGFAAEHIRAALDTGLGPVTVIENPDFREGSVVSLWAARSVLRSGNPVVLMDADVLYDDRMMDRLLGSAHPDCLLLDREIEPGDEPVKLCIRNGEIVDFRKKPTEMFDWYGESVGFFRFRPQTAAELAERVEDYVANGRRAMEYEEPIRDMMMQSPPGRFGFEDISGLPWTEIDFPEDVTKAQALLTELAA